MKILYVRNLMLSTSEDTLKNIFNQAAGNCNAVERVKKIKDYAFVHFHSRNDAMTALNVLNSTSGQTLTSCARGDTVCPCPCPPPWTPKRLARRRAEAR